MPYEPHQHEKTLDTLVYCTDRSGIFKATSEMPDLVYKNVLWTEVIALQNLHAIIGTFIHTEIVG